MSAQASDIAADVRADGKLREGQTYPASDSSDFSDRVDGAIRALVYGVLVFAPAALGGVDGWSESILLLMAFAIALLLAVRHVHRVREREFVWPYLPLALFALLVAVQLLPLPAAIVNLISPNTWAIKMQMLSAAASGPAAPKWMTLSFYPLATRQELRVILLAGVVFVAVVHVFRRSVHVLRLLSVITAVGGAAAVLAVAQDLTGARGIYWMIERLGGDHLATAGPLVNYNNYCQFANLSLGAAVGLLLARVMAASAEAEGRRSPNVRGASLPLAVKDELLQLRWVMAVIVIIAISVFLSRSRGGMIALMLGGLVGGIACARARTLAGRGWIPLSLGLVVLAALLYVGLDATLDRLATLRRAPQVAANARLAVARDVMQLLVPRFPIVGTGLGTHELVYPMVSRQTFPGLAGHVENEYVQVLEETGVIGGALVLAFAGMMAWAWLRAVRRLRRPIRAAAFGLGIGLIAVMIHSGSDFGLRVPAVACLAAACCGILVSIARAHQPQAAAPERSVSRPRSFAIGGALAGLAACAVFVWAINGSARCALGEWNWDHALSLEQDLVREHWEGSDKQFAALLVRAGAAANAEPGNVLYRHWLNVYRWRAIARPDEAGRMPRDEETIGYARRIIADLHATRRLCPTFGPPASVAGQIELMYLGEVEAGERDIETGYELTRSHPQSCYIAGSLDAFRGRWDASREKLARALVLGQPLDDVLDVYLVQSDRADLALEMARGRGADGLGRLVERLKQSAAHADVAATARAEAVALMKQQAEDEGAPPWVLASAAQMMAEENDLTAAANYYRRALAFDYGRASWHLALAQVLARAGDAAEATREARLCLRLEPGSSAARQLLDELAVASNAAYKQSPTTSSATTVARPPVH
jgi:uncharacterized membrane protein